MARTSDAPMGPREPKSTVLAPAEEAIVVDRWRTLPPLDDVLCCPRDTLPNLSRSALHRCPQRHGISHLPAAATAQSAYGTFALGIASAALTFGSGYLYGCFDLGAFWAMAAVCALALPFVAGLRTEKSVPTG